MLTAGLHQLQSPQRSSLPVACRCPPHGLPSSQAQCAPCIAPQMTPGRAVAPWPATHPQTPSHRFLGSQSARRHWMGHSKHAGPPSPVTHPRPLHGLPGGVLHLGGVLRVPQGGAVLPGSHAGDDLWHCSRPKDLLRVLPPSAGLRDGASALQPGHARSARRCAVQTAWSSPFLLVALQGLQSEHGPLAKLLAWGSCRHRRGPGTAPAPWRQGGRRGQWSPRLPCCVHHCTASAAWTAEATTSCIAADQRSPMALAGPGAQRLSGRWRGKQSTL